MQASSSTHKANCASNRCRQDLVSPVRQPLEAPETMLWLFLGEAMKVKTFTGTHTFPVDSQVNNWLARSNVKVRKTQDLCRLQSARREGVGAVAAKRRRVGTRDRDNGLVRRAVPSTTKINPATWIFKSGQWLRKQHPRGPSLGMELRTARCRLRFSPPHVNDKNKDRTQSRLTRLQAV